MTPIKIVIAVTALLTAVSPLASASSLCTKREVTYFSCKIKGNTETVSLCGNSLFGPNFETVTARKDLWLQYRYGQPNHLELAYPLYKAGSTQLFQGAFRRPNDGFFYSLSFERNGITYSLEALESKTPFRGVVVDTGNKHVRLSCNDLPQIETAGIRGNFYDLVAILSP